MKKGELHSGAYAYREGKLARGHNLATIWDGVYRKKAGQDPLTNTQERADAAAPLSKNLAYLSAFDHLGFFYNLSPQSKILQAGLGHGKTLRTIVEHVTGVEPIGLDISALALQEAKRNGVDQVVQGDILALPFKDDSIDRVFEVGVVEHLYATDPFDKEVVDREGVIASFREIHRVLKPKGKVGFIQPSRHSVGNWQKRYSQFRGKWDMGFQEDFSLTEFCQLMKIAGFDNIKYCVLQAPDDFPKAIQTGDRILKAYHNLRGDHRKAELTGAMFAVVGENKF